MEGKRGREREGKGGKGKEARARFSVNSFACKHQDAGLMFRPRPKKRLATGLSIWLVRPDVAQLELLCPLTFKALNSTPKRPEPLNFSKQFQSGIPLTEAR